MTSQLGSQIIAIHILSNFSKSKGNQTVICAQLMECNMRNNFVDKSYPKCCEETIPRTFSKKSNLSILLDH